MKILTEKTRSQLVSDSKSAQKERDGKSRYEKRLKSKIGASVREYNNINMNKFFKDDILDVNIQVYGESDNYIVTLSFGGVLYNLRKDVMQTDNLDLSAIIKAITRSFNSDDVFIHCSCPDWAYRMNYYSTKKKINAGQPEIRPSVITNPDDKLGDGCKHTMLVLANTSWIMKVARVIFNYINYMKEHQQRLYADIIYPAVYGKKYEEPTQLDVFDDTLDSDSSTIDKSNIYARTKTQFKPGNPYRYTPSQKDTMTEPFIDNVEEGE